MNFRGQSPRFAMPDAWVLSTLQSECPNPSRIHQPSCSSDQPDQTYSPEQFHATMTKPRVRLTPHQPVRHTPKPRGTDRRVEPTPMGRVRLWRLCPPRSPRSLVFQPSGGSQPGGPPVPSAGAAAAVTRRQTPDTPVSSRRCAYAKQRVTAAAADTGSRQRYTHWHRGCHRDARRRAASST